MILWLIDWKACASIENHQDDDQEEDRVREGVVGEGGAVLCSFIDWFLLLVACLLVSAGLKYRLVDLTWRPLGAVCA